MNKNPQREAFEAFVRSGNSPVPASEIEKPLVDGTYRTSAANAGWVFWQAAQSLNPVDVKSKRLTTLLTAAGARRHVRCHNGSGEPFDAYDIEISDRVVDELRKEMWALEDMVGATATVN